MSKLLSALIAAAIVIGSIATATAAKIPACGVTDDRIFLYNAYEAMPAHIKLASHEDSFVVNLEKGFKFYGAFVYQIEVLPLPGEYGPGLVCTRTVHLSPYDKEKGDEFYLWLKGLK